MEFPHLRTRDFTGRKTRDNPHLVNINSLKPWVFGNRREGGYTSAGPKEPKPLTKSPFIVKLR